MSRGPLLKGVNMAKDWRDKRVDYEWAIESTDEEGDIHDVDHSDTFPFDVLDEEPTCDERWKGKVKMHLEIALKRYFYDAYGHMDQSYAYIKDGKLPVEFCNGKRVPIRFHKEVARKMANRSKLPNNK